MVASYRISHSLAIGGMAEVFEAEHAVLPRRVALKVMHPELLRKQDMDTRFLREACILEAFTHPGGVRVFECGVLPDGRPWMAMELVRGHALSKEMHQPMSPTALVHILKSVVEVLAAAHAIGLVHRDLKPDNLLLSDGSEGYPVRVIDWGLARLETFTRLTQDGTAAGTPLYMSPEQTQGKPLDGRSDIYSLGVVAYEALSGVPPFDGQNLVEIVVRQVTTEPKPLHELRADVPRALSGLVTKMMTRDPAQRPTAAQLLPELETLCALMAPPAEAGEGREDDVEEPILEYTVEATAATEAAPPQLPRDASLEVHIEVEMGELMDRLESSAAPAPTSAQLVAELLSSVEDVPVRPSSAATSATRRRPLTPAMGSRSAMDGRLTPASRISTAAAQAAQAAAQAAQVHPQTLPTVCMPQSEPIELLPAMRAAAQAAQVVATAATAQQPREVAAGSPRLHWTPEPVCLDQLPTELAATRRRRANEITPRGPRDQVAGELIAAAGTRRR